MTMRHVILIAGPNGAGKTTLAEPFLKSRRYGMDFLNLNSLTRDFPTLASGKGNAQARALMRMIMRQKSRAGESFAVETNLSTLEYLTHIAEWKELGYRVDIIYLGLLSVELSLSRVQTRFRQGGHNLPESDIRRRFLLSRKNFENCFQDAVDSWLWFDTSYLQPRFCAFGNSPGAASLDRNAVHGALLRAAMEARLVAERSNTEIHYWLGGRMHSRAMGKANHRPVFAA